MSPRLRAGATASRSGALRRWALALGPLVVLGVMVAWFLGYGARFLAFGALPVEKLSFGRVIFRPEEIIVKVRNEGPTPVAVAQILVNDAIWDATVVPGRNLKRLGAATLYLPFAWQVGEPYTIVVITNTGVKHETTVDIATETPRPTLGWLGIFGLLGIYVGVVPIVLGFCWLPFLRTLSRSWIDFWMSFTAGLLVFLAVDTLHEALEILERVPELFNGLMLIVLGLGGAFLGLIAAGRRRSAAGGAGAGGWGLAWMIATGIGLHNLGEGLAIGAAYTLGEVALGAFLIVGFTVHNTTEGLAILSPLIRERVGLKPLAWLGLLAGAPTIAGAWIGAFTYSDPLSLLFLGLGAGAILQVVWVLVRARMSGATPGVEALTTMPNATGMLAGFLAMYLTGLLVAA